jgi:uncharacterized membrane protein
MKTPAAALSISAAAIRGPRRAMRIVLAFAIPAAVALLAIGPKAAQLGVIHGPAVHPHWPRLQLIAKAAPATQLHLAAVTIALAIGIVLLMGVKGARMHRALGWIWVLAMMTGAVSSLFIRTVNHGAFSFIHLFSGWTIVMLPMGVAFARRHDARRHARTMTGLFTGGLILAGLFAFIPGRLMWDIVFR